MTLKLNGCFCSLPLHVNTSCENIQDSFILYSEQPYCFYYPECKITKLYVFAKYCHLNVVGWLVVLKINVNLAIFQQYLDLEAGDNQSLKIQVARWVIKSRSSCSASQELNNSATAAPLNVVVLCLIASGIDAGFIILNVIFLELTGIQSE